MAREDLISITERSAEEQKRMRHNAGVKSGQTRRNKKLLKDCLEILLEKKMVGEDGKKITGAEALSVEIFQKALSGDVKAFEVLRDTAGQKPVEKVEQVNIDGEYLAKVEELREMFNGKGTE